MVTISGASFNRHPSQVKREAAKSPVVITEYDKPMFVLLSYMEYERLTGTPDNLVDWLEMRTEGDIELDIEPVEIGLRAAEL